jgi:hypothetical protein
MADPTLITGAPTAMELIADLIIAKTPGAVLNTDVFMAYTQDKNGLCRFVLDAPGGAPQFTMGTAVALEEAVIEVLVQGDPTDYVQARTEMMRLRYLIANQGEYTSRGLRMLYAQPGNINSQGRDKRNQEIFSTMFTISLEPSYV